MKLIVGKYYHIPASVVCLILVGAIVGSMIASSIQPTFAAKEHDGTVSPELKDRVAKIVNNSPFASPAPVSKAVKI